MDCFTSLLVTRTFTHRASAMFLTSGLAILSLKAQPAPSPGLHFEVASVRLNQLKACSGRWDLTASHGKVTAENAPLLRITSRAFDLTDDMVSGPGWLNSECYDVSAKASSSSVPDRDLMSMLQDLLKERFHFLSHYESVNRPAFDLVVDAGGSKMHPDGDNNAPVQWSRSDGRTVFAAKTLRDLCERLGRVTGRPVFDKTGLVGRYFIVLAYLAPGPGDSITGDAGAASDPSGDIFSAVREQLGLRLLPRREPVEILKIDNIEKIPTQN